MNSEFKPLNYRIFRRVTAKHILTIEDMLNVGKIKITLVEYQRGQGATTTVSHYLDRHVAALLAFDLLHRYERYAGCWWNGFQDYKGTPQDNGQLQARTFKTEVVEANNPFKITVSNGPGEPVGPNGAVKPAKGTQQTVVSVLLPWTVARSMALALLMHLQAWETMTYYNRITENTWQPDQETAVDPTTGEVLTAKPRRAIPPRDN